MAMTLSKEERRNCVFQAKLAMEAGRHEEMFGLMTKLARYNVETTSEEQALLTLAFKKVIDAKRSSLVSLSSLSPVSKKKQEMKCIGTEINYGRVEKFYRLKIESELSKICFGMIEMIDEHIFPLSSTNESTVFFYKVKGDCYRYLAEFRTESKKKDAVEKAIEAYKKGTVIAKFELSPINQTRLGLALNYSVMYYDIMKLPIEAYYLAIKALNKANKEEANHEKSNLIMKLLKENIGLYAFDITEKDQVDYNRRVKNQLKLLAGN